MRKCRPNQSFSWTMAVGIVLIVLGISAADALADELSRYEASHRAMGSQFTMVLYANDDEVAREGFTAAFARIAALDKALSDYDPRSELSRLSAASPTKAPIPVSDDLWRVLNESRRYHALSSGAFDVTVGPLTTLWRSARRSKQLPTRDALRDAQQAVGFEHVKLHDDAQAVSLAQANMRLDLGGIAKGFAVDEALAELKRRGIDSALINGGGDIAAGDAPPGREGWKIGVAPLERGGKPSEFLLLENQAIATSGDTWQFVEIDGRRYSHIVDPQTGLGLTNRSSVTVVSKDCTSADALASAVSVLGSEKGLKLVDEIQGAESLIIGHIDGQLRRQASRGFDDLPSSN